MRKKLFTNWGIKLISLLIAFGLWFAVVYIDDPVEEVTFVIHTNPDMELHPGAWISPRS